MKINHIKVIVASPGRTFVTVKVITDQGLYGIDATGPRLGQVENSKPVTA
ncbi:MAG: hypothetical protein H0T75_13270 [Rhizobiales bacterium]|nr:hypothetical protein [Hyphomicrobiales bacterium]